MVKRPNTEVYCNDNIKEIASIPSCGDCAGLAGKRCNYTEDARCDCIPAEYGAFCNYEKQMIVERCLKLREMYELISTHYTKKYHIQTSAVFRLHSGILFEICQTYANDLKVARRFHNSNGGCDQHRRAAFLARLIAHRRPILLEDTKYPDPYEGYRHAILQVNEKFAAHAFFHFLEIPPALLASREMAPIYSDLIFLFTYRDAQPEALVCIARMLTTYAKCWPALSGAA